MARFLRRTIGPALVLLLVALVPHAAMAQAPDPLPSWNDGAVKKSITDFVARVTTPGGPDFVPVPSASPPSTTTARCGPSSRSISRFAFAHDRVKALAPHHPEWKTKQPFKAVLEAT